MDGNERLMQALIRLVVVFLTAGVGAVAANLTILQEAISDPIFASLVFSTATAVLSAILKWLGGATEPAEPVAEGARSGGRGARAPRRPNPLAL